MSRTYARHVVWTWFPFAQLTVDSGNSHSGRKRACEICREVAADHSGSANACLDWPHTTQAINVNDTQPVGARRGLEQSHREFGPGVKIHQQFNTLTLLTRA